MNPLTQVLEEDSWADDLVDYCSDSDEEKTVSVLKSPSSHFSFCDVTIPEILRGLHRQGYEYPSEVQQLAVEHWIAGRDMLLQAKSGLGKTAALALLSLLQVNESEGDGTLCIIVCPTRELAKQTLKRCKMIGFYMSQLKVEAFYGGVPAADDKKKMEGGSPQIVVGTPGRLLSMSRKGELNLDEVKLFIVDECDQLVGNLELRVDMQALFIQCPFHKRVVMACTTLEKWEKESCLKYLRDPAVVSTEDHKLGVHGHTHYVVPFQNEHEEKLKCLEGILDSLDFMQVIIFVQKTTDVVELVNHLTPLNFPVVGLHSLASMQERSRIFEHFIECTQRIIVTTNLMERGVDSERCDLVINYDMPSTFSSYVNRAGRGGRFGTKSTTLTLVKSDNDKAFIDSVICRLEVMISEWKPQPNDMVL